MAVKFCVPWVGLIVCPVLVVLRRIVGSTLKPLKKADEGEGCAGVCVAGVVLLKGS